jgi:glutamyl-tRNA reductase
MKPELFVSGVSYRTAPLALRERFAVPARELPDALPSLRACTGAAEALLLSTCNRTEIYGLTHDPAASASGLLDFLSHRTKLTDCELSPVLYRHTGEAAACHLFRVASGLDSMVLGESEITAQVKQAYALAREIGTTGPVLNRLFEKALHSTKLLRSRTQIAEGQASIGSVVVDLTHRLFGGRFSNCGVLVWGAGKAAEVTARHLLKQGIQDLWIVSRTETKAQDLAALCRSGWLSWEQALAHLAHVDIAVICTQAPHYVIDQNDLQPLLPRLAQRPLCLIDLAVPRNVDPSVKQLPGVHLYDIDDLQGMAQAALAKRREELVQCGTLVDEQGRHFMQWWQEHLDRTQEAYTCARVEA